MDVLVRKPEDQELSQLDVKTWPIWTKEVSTFDHTYDETEYCYFLEGDVRIHTAKGITEIKPGDFVTFPAGLTCKWEIRKAVRKHYRFEG